jgi:hypothetical protein
MMSRITQEEVSLDISIDSLCIDLGDFQKEVILDISIDSLCIDLGEFQEEVSLDISIDQDSPPFETLLDLYIDCQY